MTGTYESLLTRVSHTRSSFLNVVREQENNFFYTLCTRLNCTIDRYETFNHAYDLLLFLSQTNN